MLANNPMAERTTHDMTLANLINERNQFYFHSIAESGALLHVAGLVHTGGINSFHADVVCSMKVHIQKCS